MGSEMCIRDSFNEDNTIRLKSNKTLCLTVSKENSRKGGGGSPLHLMRNVSMQKCNEKLSYYQSWGVRYFSNGKFLKLNYLILTKISIHKKILKYLNPINLAY